MKKLLCALVSVSLLASSALALPAMGDLKSKSAALYDASGQCLYEFNADAPLQPASVTKVMTMLLVMEAVDEGQATLDEMVTGSAYAASMGGTQIWLKEGEQLSLHDMMKAIAVGSANDCAVAVAEHLAGTEAAFVERMNERAQELGCTNTTFVNANGLDADGKKTITSARDIALISVELLKHPTIRDYTTIWMDSIRDGAFQLANTNKMLKSYNGLIGLKTGFISEAGYCISAAAERNGMTLVATVMAANTKEDRMADASALLNYGFANFAPYTPDLSGLPAEIPVTLGKTQTIQPIATYEGNVVTEKEKAGTLQTQINLPQALRAPVQKGQLLGEAKVLDGSTVLLTVPIVAGTASEAMGLSDIYREFMRVVLMKQAN